MTPRDLTYLGAVRTPEGVFHYGGKPASVDLLRRQYVMGTKGNAVGRCAMVRPMLPSIDRVNNRRLLKPESVPIAPLVDAALVDPSNNRWHELNRDDDATGASLTEVTVLGNMALVAGQMYYDAGGQQDVSFFACDWPLTSPSTRTPWKSVAHLGEGWAAGPMTVIPARFRELLKGDVLFGQPGGLPIVTRQSFGPCAISAWAKHFLDFDDVPANLLLGYHDGQLANWGQGANDIWNSATAYTAITFVGDYALFIGRHGYGEAGYGEGVDDRDVADASRPYDPVMLSKGTHAYPYRVQAVGYHVTDLGDVAAGRRTYDALRPAFWVPLEIPHFDHPHYRPVPEGITPYSEVTGAEYDSEACELHVCVFGQDSEGYEPGPLWHVFKVNGVAPEPNALLRLESGSVPAPPVVEPPPTPTGTVEDRIAAIEATLQHHRLSGR